MTPSAFIASCTAPAIFIESSAAAIPVNPEQSSIIKPSIAIVFISVTSYKHFSIFAVVSSARWHCVVHSILAEHHRERTRLLKIQIPISCEISIINLEMYDLSDDD
uniref:Uncharacterized protein n=1 Tax=Candidatus Methanogaster sp. ANME-2c ERB4 TaxID=2759911 RepID=A0A7G9YQH6_9EURY|nr:hypothetical protein HOIKONPE_00004 [Methanosarcinales archaeon ANME-2c ERB4]